MQRVTVTLDDDLVGEIDRLVATKGYPNRSEAIRDLARAGLQEAEASRAQAPDCVAALVYVYDHTRRELAKRLTEAFHDHHDLSVCTMHVHLDHDACLEIAVLRGATGDVTHMAEHVIAERGVRYGRLVTVPADMTTEGHTHGGDRRTPHVHVRPGLPKPGAE
jgi:CopG family nickel-responsive transcriptional regulator